MLNRILVLVCTFIIFSCSKEIIQQKLTVDWTPLNGGSVSPPTNAFEKGTIVSMVATPAGEYIFKQWSGSLSGTNNPTPITMDADKQVTGVFEKRQYPLSLTIEGSGTVKEEVIAIAPQSQYPSGTTVRLTAQPADKFEFGGWSGDLTSTANPLDLKIDKAISLKAIFSKIDPLANFKGYAVNPNAKKLGRAYWSNTTLLSDYTIAIFQKNYEKNHPLPLGDKYAVFTWAVCNGDFNNDGFMDVFNAGCALGGKKANLTFLIWNPSLKIFEEKNLINDKTNFIGGPSIVTPIYLNDDNYVDIVIHGHADELRQNTNEPVTLCLSDGKGGYDLVKFEQEPQSLFNNFTHEHGDVADLNNDNLPDIFVVANGHSYIFWGIPSFPFFTNKDFVDMKTEFAFYTKLADVNKDGSNDIMISNNKETIILYNDGKGKFNSKVTNIPFPTIIPPNSGNMFDYIVEDLNGDGLNDIIDTYAYNEGKNWTIEVLIQQTDGSFKMDNSWIEYTINNGVRGNYKNRLIYADFDGDGKKDIGYSDTGLNPAPPSNNIEMKNKTVFIRGGNKFVEKDFYQFDVYANSKKDGL